MTPEHIPGFFTSYMDWSTSVPPKSEEGREPPLADTAASAEEPLQDQQPIIVPEETATPPAPTLEQRLRLVEQELQGIKRMIAMLMEAVADGDAITLREWRREKLAALNEQAEAGAAEVLRQIGTDGTDGFSHILTEPDLAIDPEDPSLREDVDVIFNLQGNDRQKPNADSIQGILKRYDRRQRK